MVNTSPILFYTCFDCECCLLKMIYGPHIDEKNNYGASKFAKVMKKMLNPNFRLHLKIG